MPNSSSTSQPATTGSETASTSYVNCELRTEFSDAYQRTPLLSSVFGVSRFTARRVRIIQQVNVLILCTHVDTKLNMQEIQEIGVSFQNIDNKFLTLYFLNFQTSK